MDEKAEARQRSDGWCDTEDIIEKNVSIDLKGGEKQWKQVVYYADAKYFGITARDRRSNANCVILNFLVNQMAY